MNSYTGKPELTTAADITNDGWWPTLAMADLMAAYRIPSELDNILIKDRLVLAIIEVNERLSTVKLALMPVHSSLAAYNTAHPDMIDGVDITVTKYKEAVFSHAKALILPQVKSMIRKAEAENLAKEAPETEQYWMTRSSLAVQWFFNKFLHDAETDTTPTAAGSVSVSVI